MRHLLNRKNKNNSIALTTALLLTVAPFISAQSLASNDLTTSSYGSLKQSIDTDVLNNTVEANKQSIVSDQISGKAKAKTRQEVLQSKQKNRAAKTTNTTNNVTYINRDFSIYQAYSSLLEDVDSDGYFSTFSVSFDVDVFGPNLFNNADIYAELYLSKNGGPWLHYFTTDAFSITNNGDSDEYEVITTLQNGYNSDTYDVLVDVYEVGYSDIVATISSDETSNLYALPLESRDQDPEYVVVETVEVSESYGHGGSFSILILLIMSAFIYNRYK